MLRARVALAGLVVLLGACGGDDDGGGPMGPTDGDGTVTATVTGSGTFNGTLSVVAAFTGNSFGLSASQLSGGSTRTLAILMANVTATGTAYSLTAAGNAATYSETASNGETATWICNIVQGSGTVTFSKLSASEVVGEFSFSAPTNTGTGATGTKTIVGSFNVKPSNPE